MLKKQKIEQFKQPVQSLPDTPKFTAEEMKAAFDACPEELRHALNGVIDDLSSADAAAQLGFQRSVGIPADTVQTAMEAVQRQVIGTALGQIPNGSVDNAKLAQDVQDRFSALSDAVHAESQQRAEADNHLQMEIQSANQQIATTAQQLSTKCELYFGHYVGDGQQYRYISLGFTPKMIFIMCAGYILHAGNGDVYGGMALPGIPVRNYTWDQAPMAIEIAEGGFNVAKIGSPTSTNANEREYTFLTVK